MPAERFWLLPGGRTMRDADAENLLGEKSELDSWTMVRSHGGAASGSLFRLSEDTTLHNSHDMRAALAIRPEAGKSYSFGVMVRPGERGLLSIWIGNGVNRAEAVFDVAGATVKRRSQEGAGWIATDAGMTPAGDGWLWCHLTARATTADGNIGISILLMREAASGYYDGDGKSGLWLMKPWLAAGERLAMPLVAAAEMPLPQNDTKLNLVEELNALIVGFVAERYRAMGLDASGLYAFYVKRLETRRLLIHYDLGLADWIVRNRPRTDLIVDVGTGIGQFSFLLAANGRDCIAFEGKATRFDALEALHGAVKYWKPEVAARVTLLNGQFPLQIGGLAGKKSLAVFACFVATMDADAERQLVRGLRQFSEVILDLRVFGRKVRETPQERAELLALLHEEGFSEPEPVLVSELAYYVIIRDRAARQTIST